MSMALSTGNAKAALKVRGDDLYETPESATLALLKVEQLPQYIWEPACGPGAIVRVLRAAGHTVLASDLVDYGNAESFWGRDFLMEFKVPDKCEAIVTNPPFKLAGEFVAHALELCPRVVMLLRLAFIESERRSPILDTGYLARIHVFKNRLPMMHRNGWQGNQAGSAVCYAWFVWDKAHKGPTTIHRISHGILA